MDSRDNPFSEFLSLFKSWFQWRPDPSNLSRDFWMPDESCRVCYECDTQFTIIIRRHHCRLCGRVFCGRCTRNSIPAEYTNRQGTFEEWERVRVCNYCFKQWRPNLDAVKNEEHLPDQESNTSPSATSQSSCKSIKTSNSCYNPMSPSVESPRYAQQSSNLISNMSSTNDMSVDGQCTVLPGRSSYDASGLADQAVPYPSQYGFSFSRDYIDGDHYDLYQSDSEAILFPQENDYNNRHHLDDLSNNVSESFDMHDDQNKAKAEQMCVLHGHHTLDSHESNEFSRLNRKDEENFISDAASSTADDISSEPVDFENNGILWLPPEPEDEEDEKEDFLFDDDDEGDGTGEWGYLRSSDSFGSGEFRNKDRSVEEQKKVMKNVIYGHFRALIAQLLQVEDLPVGEESSEDSWLDTITSLSWEAATLLKPDMSTSGGMDPGGYVKVKCVASGRCSDSVVVKGVVCKKNVAHRRMISRIEKPRILILGGALEYQRVANHLSSFDTLLQQEMDHLKMAVAKIDAHHPDVLLVENSVSRYAQEYLLAKDISLVLNIKRPLLERIARCAGAQIVPSIDHLSSQKLGYCEKFHVQRILEEHGTAGQGGKKLTKTLMYFEGCPKPLGYTILLKGAPGDQLKKIKHVVQYGVFAAYHLGLETSFLADEGASLPEFPLTSPITVAFPDKSSNIVRSISTIPGFTIPSVEKPRVSEPQISNSIPVLSASNLISNNSVEKLQTSPPTFPINSNPSRSQVSSSLIESISPVPAAKTSWKVVSDCLDNLLGPNGAIEETREKMSQERNGLSNGFVSSEREIFLSMSGSPRKRHDFVESHLAAHEESASAVKESGPVVAVAEPSKDGFPPSPSDHQSILVSLSSRCVWKGTICERSHLFRIKYYGSFDKPLGRFLRDHLFDQGYRCDSCEMPSEAHVHCYTHRQGTLTISVKNLPEVFLPGQKDGKIWMWHRCLQCPRINGFPPATRRVVMSDAAWGLSFGKFLELSFSNHAAASRVASCGHSLHRDCLRFYGFGNMVACFRYACIDVHSVYLPPPKLDFSYNNTDWIQKDADEVVNWAELLFSEVLNALSQIAEKRPGGAHCTNGVFSSDLKHCIAALEEILQKEKSEFEESFEKISRKEAMKNQLIMDILDLNRLRRQLLFQSYIWDRRLVFVSNLNKDIANVKKNLITEEKENINCPDMILAYQNIVSESERDNSESLTSDVDIIRSVGVKGDTEIQDKRPNLATHEASSCESMDCIAPSNSTCDCSEPLESGIIVQRTASEGQFPTERSLSDSLDAAWTGENQPAFLAKKEISHALSDSAALSSLRGDGPGVALSVNGFSDDLGKVMIPNSLSTNFSAKDSDHNGNDSGWLGTPLMTSHFSFYKELLSGPSKLDLLSEYNPVYISCLRESELQGGGRLLLPVGINDTIIPVYDDEPTSIIAYALTSPAYHSQLFDEGEKLKDGEPVAALSSTDVHSDDVHSEKSLGSVDENTISVVGSRGSASLDPVSYTKALHAKVSFGDDGPLGKAKYSVTCYYAKRFAALRRVCCPSEVDYVRSLSRCKKWGAQGGKSNVFFAKTLDERFVIKQVTKTELESFIKFAPAYFKYLFESIDSRSPTCLAKIVGIYQVTSKNIKGGKMDVLVMENLLFQRNVVRLYDLKGSSRSRYNPDSSGANKVLLDQNLIESMPTSPIFVGNKAKRLLERAVWNDTSFLASIDVMDYSLLVGIDEEKHELVLGIIDFMRQYTWDKHLETWVKASGILGGPNNAPPTVISPKQYKKRFRKAMTTYFLMVPDQWSPPTIIPSESQSDLREEDTQDALLAE